MKKELQKIKKDFEKSIEKIRNSAGLEKLENQYFSRKSGLLTLAMKQLKDLSEKKRKEYGKFANEIKKDLQKLVDVKQKEFESKVLKGLAKKEAIDVTQPNLDAQVSGHIHPTTQIQYDLEDLFTSMGFVVEGGPELESEYYNFEGVNIPVDHPARDMQDTFFIKNQPGRVMRTHTSSVQVRAMRKHGAPMRVIVPGRCFRNEATDARHEHTFYQLEGMVIDKDINLAHMKGILQVMAKHLYGDDTVVRLRPKHYPFVEPGVNGEVTCYLCKGDGCSLCKKTGWLEIFGAGMIHPNVLKEGDIDPEQYQGFAFGFGLDRVVMLKYGIEDVRHFQSGDLRFLNQF